MHPDAAKWAERWQTLGTSVLGETLDAARSDPAGVVRRFTDERGFARVVDRHVLWRVVRRAGKAEHVGSKHGTPGQTSGQSSGWTPPELSPAAGLDARLWHALTARTPPPDLSSLPDSGPLTAGDRDTIEVRTETELCALHALWGVGSGDASLRERCFSAARWHVEELQPDNATGRPWAAHVFAMLAATADDDEVRAGASMHADWLTHGCMVSFGRPDLVSAAILLDASAELTKALVD